MAETRCSEDAEAEVARARLLPVPREAAFAKARLNQTSAAQSEQIGSAIGLSRREHNGMLFKTRQRVGDRSSALIA